MQTSQPSNSIIAIHNNTPDRSLPFAQTKLCVRAKISLRSFDPVLRRQRDRDKTTFFTERAKLPHSGTSNQIYTNNALPVWFRLQGLVQKELLVDPPIE
jgi:hypothetical protein